MHQGRLVSREGRSLLFLTGSPYEMGFQQGMLLREPIRDFYAGLWQAVRRDLRLIPHFYLHESARRNAKYLPSDVMEEWRGIAEGADVPLSQVLFLNDYENLLSKIPGERSSGTQFAVWGKGTALGNMIQAKNYDAIDFGLIHDFWVMAFHKPAEGYMFVTPQMAGTIAPLMALNEKGITVSSNSIDSRDRSAQGIPHALLCRRIATQASSLQEAIDIVEASRRVQTPGVQIMISDGKANQCAIVELTRRQFSIIRPHGECEVTGGHFHSAGMQSLQRRNAAASMVRCERARQLLEQHRGNVTVETAQKILSDHEDLKNHRERGSAFTVCCHEAPARVFPGICRNENTSLCSVIADSERLTLLAAFGKTHAPHGDYRTYPLRDSWTQRRAPRVIPYSPDAESGPTS